MTASDVKPPDDPLARRIAHRVDRRRQARRHRRRSTWFGLGMYGMVGWSIAIPTLLGVAVGLWLDAVWPGPFSWTLMLMSAGLLAGCWTAWYWVSLEQRAIRNSHDADEEGEGRDDA